MKTSIIRIDKPCSENWNEMTASDKGHFCQSCSKFVIDFTKSTPDDIAKSFENTQGEICGRILPHQLDDILIPTNDKKNFDIARLDKAASVLVAASLIVTQSINAQTTEGTEPVKTEQTTQTNPSDQKVEPQAQNIPAENFEMVQFTGHLSDEETGEPILNARISFVTLGRVFSAYTDTNGVYNLNIPEDAVKNKNIVAIRFDDVDMGQYKELKEGRRDYDYDEYFKPYFVRKNIVLIKSQILEGTNFETKLIQPVPVAGGMRGYSANEPLMFVDGIELDHATRYNDYRPEGKNHSQVKDTFLFHRDIAKVLLGRKTDKTIRLVYTRD